MVLKISVCVPTTRPDTVGDTIASIQKQDWPDWELLVVTQMASTELRSFVDRAAANDGRIRHIALSGRGLSLARNAGVDHATGDVVAMIDDDAEARGDWLSTIAACFADDLALGLVGGAVRRPPGDDGKGNCPTCEPEEIRYIGKSGVAAPMGWDWIGCNFAFRRELVDHFGPFDEQLGAGAPFPSMEDTDFKLRLEAVGVPMLATPRSVVFHTHGVRKGLDARLHHQRNYSLGKGAMAAKLTMQGDPRGNGWRRDMRRECLIGWLLRGRLDKCPSEWRRFWYFSKAYRACTRSTRFDPVRGVLVPLAGAPGAKERIERSA